LARGKTKKPSEPKCRGCNGLLEGGNVVKIGGAKWHIECARKNGKKVPKEYDKPS
jgi:hypothetical protein